MAKDKQTNTPDTSDDAVAAAAVAASNEQWDRVRVRLRAEFGNAAYKSWLQPISLTEVDHGRVTRQVPTRVMQEADCDAVKPQGGKSQAHILKALVDAGIPTASHIGLTPHTIAMFGGFKIQGRTADAAMKILEDALAIQDAGCFMLEFEAVPAKIASVISQQLEIPTIGIGAGVGTDGQILLSYDLLGVFTDFKPKFTKRYANLTEVAVAGLKAYVAEVKQAQFPDDDHSYGVNEAEYEKFMTLVEKRRQH